MLTIRSFFLPLGLFFFTLVLASCGGGSGNDGDYEKIDPDNIPVSFNFENAVPESNLQLIEVSGDINSTNLLAGITIDGSDERLYALGQRESGKITLLDSIVFEKTVNNLTYRLSLIIDSESGLPKKITSSNGEYIIFTNWTESTVDISEYDVNDRIINSSTTISFPKSNIQELLDLYNEIDNSDLSRTVAAKIDNPIWNNPGRFYDFMGSAMNIASCVGAGAFAVGAWTSIPFTFGTSGVLAIGATGLVAASCSSAIVSTAAAVTDNKALDASAAIIDSHICFVDGASCVSAFFDYASLHYNPDNPTTKIYLPIESARDIELGTEVRFAATYNTVYGDITKAQWDFGDGTTYSNMDEVAVHIFNTEGIFTVTFTITYDDNTSISDQITIIVSKSTTDSSPASTIFSEDFSTDPNFTSLSSTYAYWDATQENYYVQTRDNLNDEYWAYSPSFPEVDTSKPAVIQFDVMFEYQDWGTYPGVRFFNNEPIDLRDQNNINSFYLFNAYSDNYYKKIGIIDSVGNRTYTPTISDDVWYGIRIELSGNDTASITVTRLSDNAIIHEVSDITFIPQNLSYMGIGYYGPADYGDSWSPIRVDNVQISGSIKEGGDNNSVGYDGYAITSNLVTYGANYDQACIDEFGTGAIQADWIDLEAYYSAGNDMNAFISGTGFDTKVHAWAKNSGSTSYSGTRDYFASFNNHSPHSGYLEHDQFDNSLFSLGSWYTSNYVFCDVSGI